jgi:hypothetical protein
MSDTEIPAPAILLVLGFSVCVLVFLMGRIPSFVFHGSFSLILFVGAIAVFGFVGLLVLAVRSGD